MSEYVRVPVIGGSGQIGGTIGEGIFDPFGGGGPPQHYAKTWYEAQEPVVGWALEKKPGVSYRPGQQDAGLVMIGPSMGTAGDEAGGLVSRIWPWAVAGAVGVAVLALVGAISVPFISPVRANPKKHLLFRIKGWDGRSAGSVKKILYKAEGEKRYQAKRYRDKRSKSFTTLKAARDWVKGKP